MKLLVAVHIAIMILTHSQILSLIKNPQNQGLIRQAQYEERLLCAYGTGENIMSSGSNSQDAKFYNNELYYTNTTNYSYYRDVILWEYLSLLVPERHAKFRQTFGIHTMPIMDKVQTHFQRIFDATGRFIDSKFENLEEKRDFEQYIKTAYESSEGKQNGLSFLEFFKREAIKAIVFAPNTALVIDFPARIDTDNDEIMLGNSLPNVQKVSVFKFWDIKVSSRGVEYIIIKSEIKSVTDKQKVLKTQYFVIDSEKYVLYEKPNKSQDLDLIIEEFHTFPKAPVDFIAQQDRYKTKYFPKKSVAWDSIDDLKKWLFIANLMKVYQYESGVPVSFELQQKCRHKERYYDPRTQQYNQTDECGSLYNMGSFNIPVSYDQATGKYGYERRACLSCKKKTQEKMSWGKKFEIPESWFENKGESVKALLQTYATVDFNTEIITVNEESLQGQRSQIEIDIIGKGYNSEKSKEAKNTDQVFADLQDLHRVLSSVSEQTERSMKFTLDYIALGRGYTTFISNEVFLGRGYLLQSTKQNLEEYKELRENGVNPYFLNRKQFEMFQSQYGYDKATLELFEIFASLTPYGNLPLTEVYKNYNTYKENPKTLLDFYKRIYADQIMQEFITKNDVQLWGRDVGYSARYRRIERLMNQRAQELAENYQEPSENDLENLEETEI